MDPDSSLTCHECGSSIEGATAFCPYCGISLQAVSVENDVVDDSMESTIMMSQSEALKLASSGTSTDTSPDNDPGNSEKAEARPAKDPSSALDDRTESVRPESEDEVLEPSATGEAIDDIPVPSILATAGKTDDSIRTPRTSEYSDEEIKQDSVPDDTLSGAEPTESDMRATETDEEISITGTAREADAESLPLPQDGIDLEDTLAEAQLDSGASTRDEDELEEQTPTPQVTEGEEPAELKAGEPKVQGTPTAPEPTVEPEGKEIVAAADEEVGAVAHPDESAAEMGSGISKPGDDLSQFEGDQGQPMFDSVQIMDPTGVGADEYVETRLHPSTLSGGKKEPVTPEAVPPVESQEPSDVVSSTSHSIGMVDTDGKKGAKLKPLAEGTILHGRYEIIRKIGGGGMGAVYLASDNNLGGVLRAVKEMVQTHIEEDQQEKAINDFKRESMILSSLDHISIPTIYDYFYEELEGRFYLVMKYISGGDLSSRVRAASEGRLDERTVCEWAVQIIDVLDYLHNQPSTIVYRDLKPSNIMIDGNSGRAMLIDFGIARSISQKEEKGVTAVGTMGYAPPELFSGNVEPRSDIYSLGSTMFHLLTGADPQSNPLLIFDFQKNPRPRQINPQLSDQIERIMMKAVQYNAEDRFKSASEMRDVLEDHLLKLKAGIVTFGVSEIPASVSLAHQSVFCGFCGQRIVATDMFCAFCGAKQPIAQQGVHAEIYSPGAMTARLVVEGTSELTAPAYSLLKEENLLGRRDPMSNIFPEVDLSKYDPQTKISRRHARIWREGSNFLLEDLGSSNGTILTKSSSESIRLVPKQPQMLAAGDRIRVGDATLHFIVG